MYLSHYNIKIEPFSISTDSKFLWLGEKHKEALAALKYGILANKGFLLLTGDVGTGKTTLIHALVNNLGRQVFAATVHDPGLETLDFLNFIAGAFKLKRVFKSKGEFLSYFTLFLKFSHAKNKKVLLVIDEAQRLSDELLEEIRMLSNIERQDTKLINIFFVGQNEFNEILIKKENRALRQRITLVHTLKTLNLKETHEYVHYRLKVAGSTRNIFKPDAIEEVYSFSGGFPRLINIICDRALLTGFVREKNSIDAQIIQECANELRIPIKTYEKEDREPPPSTAERNSDGIASKRPSRFTIRTVFLMLLLFLTVVAFYYQHPISLSEAYLKKSRDQWMDAAGVAKTGSGYRTEPARESDSGVAPDAGIVPGGIDPQKTAAALASSGPALEKESPDHPENIPIVENTVQPPEPTAAAAPQTSDPSDAGSFQKKTTIYFEYNSFELSDEALSELDKLLAVLNQNPDLNILVKGYTDKSGTYRYNLKLSELRAVVVKNHLVKKGLDPLKINASGLGPDQTMADRSDEKKNPGDRRVEIELRLSF